MAQKNARHYELPFQKDDVVETDITDFGSEGEGVAKISGVPLFIRGAIPGERVRAKVIGVKSSHGFGLIEKILAPSPFRVEPPCPYFPRCGGCTLQHVEYGRQLEFKRAHIVNTVRKIAGVDLPLGEVEGSERQYRYRNKLSLPVRERRDGEIGVGFFRRNSHDLVEIEDCLLQTEGCRGLIAELKKYMDLAQAPPYSETEQSGEIRHITLRDLGGVKTVTLVGAFEHPNAFITFSKALRRIYDENFAYYYNYNPHPTNVVYGRDFTFLAGQSEPVTVDGLKMRIHPAGFFQINDSVREKLYAYTVDKAAGSGAERAIEAYAGAGVLAAKLAPHFKTVAAVEISPESVRAGEEIKKLNGIKNLHFIQGDCAAELEKLFRGQGTGNGGTNNEGLGGMGQGAGDGETPQIINHNVQITNKDDISVADSPSLPIHCSPFTIQSPTPHSSFLTPHSSPLIPNSPSTIHHSPSPVLILDPPRQGLEPAVTDTLNRCGPDTVIYVSCNPATFARDLKRISETYAVTEAAAFDMFPQTPNAELVAVLKRR